MEAQVGLLAAFGAGVASFVSPCVLPLVPGYLSFMTGLSLGEIVGQDRRSARLLVPALLFVAGFSAVFVALGATASALGAVLAPWHGLLERVAGAVVALLGFSMLGIVRVPWLYGEARFDMGGARRFGRWAAPVMGMAFAFGWTPCVGPVLGSILMLAGSGGEPVRGALLLGAYSAGLGVPFVLGALLLGRWTRLIRRLSRHAVTVNRVAGMVLVALGLLIAADRLRVVVGWVSALMPGMTTR